MPPCKYLIYRYSQESVQLLRQVGAGISHRILDVKALVREAVWLGRVPVFLNSAMLGSKHNWDVEFDDPWSKYLDINNIEVYFRLENFTRNVTLSAITLAEFDALHIPASEQLDINAASTITADDNQRFRVISRVMGSADVLWGKQRSLSRANFFVDVVVTDKDQKKKEGLLVEVHMPISQQVKDMALQVKKMLPDKYVGMHLRRGDFLQCSIIMKITSPKFILRRLKQLGITTDTALFIMTNEIAPNFLNPIRKKYRVFTYKDFPNVVKGVTFSSGMDNYLLFMVERTVVRQAETYIRAANNTVVTRDGVIKLPNKSVIPRYRCDVGSINLDGKYHSIFCSEDIAWVQKVRIKEFKDLYSPFELRVWRRLMRIRHLLILVRTRAFRKMREYIFTS